MAAMKSKREVYNLGIKTLLGTIRTLNKKAILPLLPQSLLLLRTQAPTQSTAYKRQIKLLFVESQRADQAALGWS